MKATVSRKASKQNATASPNTGFAAHSVRPNSTFGGTSYMLGTLYAIGRIKRR